MVPSDCRSQLALITTNPAQRLLQSVIQLLRVFEYFVNVPMRHGYMQSRDGIVQYVTSSRYGVGELRRLPLISQTTMYSSAPLSSQLAITSR